MPENGDLELYITNAEGIIVFDTYYENLNAGNQNIDLTNRLNLASGVYLFSMVCNGKYNAIEKVIISK